ncbi:hypothetical protein GKODMF_13210 [Candidatus Electrothrix gigas]
MDKKNFSILFVTDSLRANHGVAKSGIFILQALRNFSNEISIISNECSAATKDLLHEFDLSLNCVTVPPKPLLYKGVGWLGPRTIARIFRSFLNYIKWTFRKQGVESDLIFVNGSSVSYKVWKRIEHQSFGKKILIIHESPRHFQVSFLISLEKNISFLKSFDALIFVSNRGRKEWLGLLDCHNILNFYIPNCADEAVANKLFSVPKSTVKSEKYFTQTGINLLCLGTIEQRKGQDYLIDNFSLILEVYRDAYLYLVGSDASGWALQLKQKVKKMGLNSKIHFLPYQKNGMELIYASDILIVPSRAEAMPLVVLEAMCLKTPVIASNVDGITELIEHNNTGWLFDLEKIETFRYAVESTHSEENRKRVADNACKKYWDSFSQKQLAIRYISALKTLMN